jgi:hypothetical protein
MVQGSFNEKASVSQIMVDAVIGMIPLVGDVTAVRDLIAVSLGMADNPAKRESKLEWVSLVVLIFALLPVIGGVIKGVGKLVIKAARAAEALTGAARMAHLKEAVLEIFAFLNRIGWKNAEAWFKSLKMAQHQAELLSKFKMLMDGLIDVLKAVLEKMSWVIPASMERRIEALISGFRQLKDKGVEMIPEAVKKLDGWLREMQQALYSGGDTLAYAGASAAGAASHVGGETAAHMSSVNAGGASAGGKGATPAVDGGKPPAAAAGESHTATAGQNNKSLATEAYLIERPPTLPVRSIRGGMPQNVAIKGREKEFAHIYTPEPGYPNLFDKGIREHKKLKYYSGVEANSGRIIHRELRVGDECYRIWGPEGITYGQKIYNSYPNSRPGSPMWVGLGTPPANAKAWREGAAVLDEWNRDFFRIRMEVVNANAPVKIKATCGTIAEQFSDKIPGQYLPGGHQQALVQLPDDLYAKIGEVADDYLKRCQDYIEQMKQANEEFLKTGAKPTQLPTPPDPPKPWIHPETGLKITIEPTGWYDVNGHWGYGVRPDRQLITAEQMPSTALMVVPKTNKEVFR